jgi:hypothetical protein
MRTSHFGNETVGRHGRYAGRDAEKLSGELFQILYLSRSVQELDLDFRDQCPCSG